MFTQPVGVSDQDILRAAVTAGAVHEFAPRRPHLSELFNNVVVTPRTNPRTSPEEGPILLRQERSEVMLGLVIKREFTTLLGSKAMKISTTVLVLLFLVAGLVGRFLSFERPTMRAQTLPIP